MSVSTHSFPRAARSMRLVLLSACILSLAGPAAAQERDRGEEIVNGLLRALIESQLQRGGRRHESHLPGPPVPVPNQPTGEMLQLRPVLATVNQETATLVAALNAESRRSFELRQLLPDALRIQASATALVQQAQSERNHAAMVVPCQGFSSDWKIFAHQLRQFRGINPLITQRIDRLDALDAQFCALLGIQDRFDSRELVRAADLLSADLHSLSDEVSFNASSVPQGYRISAELQNLHQQSHLFADLVSSGAAFPAIVSEYQTLFQSWQRLRPGMDDFRSRSITRIVTRVQETHRTIHQVLRLDFGIDHGLVVRLSQTVEQQIADLFRSVTLDQLIALPDSARIAQDADVLAGIAQNLTEVVSRHEDARAAAESWLYLDEAWRLFAYYINPIQDPGIRRQVEGIYQNISALRSTIGIQVAYDADLVLQQAVALHAAADHLEATIQKWQRRPGSADASLAQLVQQMENRCRELESQSRSRRERAALRITCDQVILAWQQLRPRLQECQTEERPTIDSLADNFTPALIRIRTMLED